MARSSRNKRKKKSPKRKKKIVSSLNATNADRHKLYQESVQDPDTALEMVNEIYSHRRDRMAMAMREDFCGTAYFSAHWVKSDPDRTAVGIDLDEETLDWGIQHNIDPLGDAAKRVGLLKCDVLEAPTDNPFDIITAFNFSYWVFHERNVMLAYFKKVRESLDDDGVFILDIHGGPDSQFRLEEPTSMGEFDYIWDQDSFDPITHKTVCHIHFAFQDRSRLDKAFTYEWRLWTLPELKDILKDAGFSDVDVWWDADNGDDEYEICESTENMEAWVAYVAAWKKEGPVP